MIKDQTYQMKESSFDDILFLGLARLPLPPPGPESETGLEPAPSIVHMSLREQHDPYKLHQR